MASAAASMKARCMVAITPAAAKSFPRIRVLELAARGVSAHPTTEGRPSAVGNGGRRPAVTPSGGVSRRGSWSAARGSGGRSSAVREPNAGGEARPPSKRRLRNDRVRADAEAPHAAKGSRHRVESKALFGECAEVREVLDDRDPGRKQERVRRADGVVRVVDVQGVDADER